jgi:DNA repair photolyase
MAERAPDRIHAQPDALQPGGRGARSNVSGRYLPTTREPYHDGWDNPDDPPARPLRTVLIADKAKTIVSRHNSPDISFQASINPYQGCEHGCIYCYARPTHARFDLSPGLDFESRIFWKPEAATLLEAEFARPRYAPVPIVIGGNTDPYQPAEREKEITRGLLKVFLKYRHPVMLITKGALVARDLDLLGELARMDLARAAVSVTTLDRKLARQMEPRAATPERRLWAIEQLAKAGVPVTIMTAPVVPGLTEHELEALLERGRDAGATSAGYVLLRLPLEIADLFKEWLATSRPDAAARVMSLMRQSRGGKDYDSRWGVRQTGQGPMAQLIARRFRKACERLGLNQMRTELRTDLFIRPPDPRKQDARQGSLF